MALRHGEGSQLDTLCLSCSVLFGSEKPVELQTSFTGSTPLLRSLDLAGLLMPSDED